MNSQEAHDAFSRAKPLLKVINDLMEAVEVSASAEKITKDALVKKDEAEKAYKVAHAQRDQIIEATRNLNADYAKRNKELLEAYAKKSEDLAVFMSKEEINAKDRLAQWGKDLAAAEAKYIAELAKAKEELLLVVEKTREAQKLLDALKAV